MHSCVQGGEGIIIHNNKVVLGVQKMKRWYNLDNNKKGAIVKTIGGAIEPEDKRSSKKALIREVLEEIDNISKDDLVVSYKRVFKKEIKMSDYNPFDKNFHLKMTANFYVVSINSKKDLVQNDLPFLVEIPISDFIKMKINQIISFDSIRKYVNSDKLCNNIVYPDYISLFVPEEVVEYLSEYEK